MTVVVSDNILPTFNQIGPYCVGATPAALPAASIEGFTGTWDPATISTAAAGSTVYTFTPTTGLCATQATMTVVVSDNILPTFNQIGPYCVGATPAALPAASIEGFTGTWDPATISTAAAGSTVYTFTPTTGLCATQATMTVVVSDNILPTFNQIGPYCVGATPAALPAASIEGFTGTWDPATISTAAAGSTVYTFTPTTGLCATQATMTVVVSDNILPTFNQIGPYCVGATPAALPAASIEGFTGTWDPATISTAAAGSTVYTFTPTTGLCATQATMTVVVSDNILPTFTQIGPYCVGATPASLPAASIEGFTGTWEPATISTAAAGSTVYTFTPTTGLCATQATMTVVVSDNILPTFNQIGPYCVGATPAALPAASIEGFTGTWDPATISTAAAGSTVYTFTPTTGLCATQATMTVVVSDNILPTFNQIGPYCVGATPAALPAASIEGFTGTWDPATISTAAAGSTVYTFTPTTGLCATQATMTVVVSDNILPTFNQIGPYCVGATPAALPAASIEGFTGTWDPATISTAAAGSTVYTFTPTTGLCATQATMTVVVSDNILPTFNQIGPYCVGATPAALPAASIEGFTGTWDPATISTAAAGSTVYTFTPTTGLCATQATMTVVVSDNILPTFNQIGPYCVGATPAALPAASIEGFTGTWDPATISTAAAGSTVYTFTPTTGLCATQATMTVVVSDNILPTFNQIGPYCVGATPAALPAASIEGFTGTWDPATISTAAAGSTVYTFTPTTGLCATQATMTVVVSDNILPTFNQIGPYCVGATPAALPAASIEGFTGTWDPATISTAAAGSTVYTFTPTTGLCATQATMTITVNPNITPTFDAISPICQNSAEPALPSTSLNGITGTWSPATINTTTAGTTTYTFTPDAGQCATTATMAVFVANSDFAITKTATEANYSTVGDVIHYTLVLANTGNTAISPVNVSDPGADVTPGIVRGADQAGNNDNILDVSEIWTYSAQHTITQSDINAGGFTNSVTATGSSTTCDPENATASVTVPADQRPSLTIDKTSTNNPNTYDAAGDMLTYNLTVTNDGNVTLTNINVSDPIAAVTGSPIASLAPGISVTLTASYTATQNDLNAGSVYNTATASTTFGTVNVIASDDETIIATQLPELQIVKSADRATYIAPGEIINYSLLVTNTGNVTITGVTVSDPNAVVTCTGAPYTLVPGASTTCTATHTVTATDIVAGSITNSATVAGLAPNLSPVAATSNIVTVLLQNLPPVISCPVPIATNTSATSCDILISSGLVATYSDPNNNIATVTWVMTGATTAVSPITGINDLSSHTFNLGATTVTYTVTDALGESASCSFTVTVTDNINPTAVCRNIDVNLDVNTGTVNITATQIDGGSYDNCGIASMAIDITSFDCSDLGANNVILTVVDNFGNTGTCTAIVTVRYASAPQPVVTPQTDVICNGETINLALTNNIPNTTWTWTVNSPNGISGTSDDNTGLRNSINQTISNSADVAHQVVYTITPRVYGACNLEPITAHIWVNPVPQIDVSSANSILCYGESAVIDVVRENPSVRGQWVYDLIVAAEPGVTGNKIGGTYTSPTDLTEILFNSTTETRHVVYSFTPRIIPEDGGADCTGLTETVTLVVYPRITYTVDTSNYNGYNISCYGLSDGFIRITPTTVDLGPFTYSWTGPGSYMASTSSISGLIAGQYTVIITDKNGCPVSQTFNMRQPGQLGMTFDLSLSNDGLYNINCHGAKTGSITVIPVNNVGAVSYRWYDGAVGNPRNELGAGSYGVAIMDANRCQASGTATLTEPPLLEAEYDITHAFCPEAPDAEIDLTVTGGSTASEYQYVWIGPNGYTATTEDITGILPGDYTVTVTDFNDCSITVSMLVRPKNELCLKIPEAFSPNGDLINDTWDIATYNDNIDLASLYPDILIKIYNRWGQKLWESEPGYPEPWDGRSNGVKLPIELVSLHN